MSVSDDERTPLVPPTTANATARLYSGELDPEEHENLSNQLQEDSEWRHEDVHLLPSTTNSFWRRNRRLLVFIAVLLIIILANILVIYFVYFHNCVRLKVLAYNVWGMPGGQGGCKDKTQRIKALAKEISSRRLGANGEDFDLILLEELWMSGDHYTIQNSLPKGFYMTEFRDLASSWCDGRADIFECSGLAIISRYPFKEKEFHQYTWKGSIWDGEWFAGKGIGRVRIEPKPNLTIDVFVTHTIADSGITVYNNTYARIKQVEELMDSYILKSTADAVILGGDFNTGPSMNPGDPFQIIVSKGMTNSIQEIFYKLDEWLQPRFSTYGNPRNTYSFEYSPIIYDYIFHRTVSKMTVCWTNWFELPLFTTKLLGEMLHETANYSSELSSADNIGKSLIVSLSDHEPVISTLYIRKWSDRFPYL